MNTTNYKLDIRTWAAQIPLFIDDEHILAALGHGEKKKLVPLSSLSAWYKALSKTIITGFKIVGNDELRRRINLTRFCLCRLIPYLKFLDTENETDLERTADLDKELMVLGERATNLQQQLRSGLTRCTAIDVMRDIFCVPCEVTPSLVIPLQPVGNLSHKNNDIIISDFRLRRRQRLARPLNMVIAEVEAAVKTGLYSHNGYKGLYKEFDKALLNDLDSLIKRWFTPIKMSRYELVYKDRYHQLLYNPGSFVLVRGPLHNRTNKSFFVGLGISETNREKFLAVPPVCCKNLEELWTAKGTLITSGMCMGNNNQYQRLKSPVFADEEALVHWLDAGVIISTGVTALHREEMILRLEAIRRSTIPTVRRHVRK